MPRPGYLTPSTFSDLMSNGRGSDQMGKTALKIVDNLIMDLLGVIREEEPTPKTCQWGIDHEWEAIQKYQEETFREVQCPVDFKESATHSYVGGTMDGLIGKNGGIEIKCPFSSNEHLNNLKNAKQFKTIYKYQLQGYFWIFELEWIDCVSYDPRFPEPNNLTIHRVYPDLDIIEALKTRCELAYEMAFNTVNSITL